MCCQTVKMFAYLQRCCSFQRNGLQFMRFASNKGYFDDPGSPRVALSKDGKTIAMYHPPKAIEYEKTIPIPRHDPRYSFENVDYLVQERLEMSDLAHRPVENPSTRHMFPLHDRDVLPTVMELANMFYTTKHRWFSNKEERKRKIPPRSSTRVHKLIGRNEEKE